MFQFTLQSLLRIRQQERDLQRQSTADFRRSHDRYVAERDELIFARNQVLNELRRMNQGPALEATQVLQRHQHAEQLGIAISLADKSVSRAANALEESIGRLIIADQSVRALEQLKDRKQVEFRTRQDKAATHDFAIGFQRRPLAE